MNNAPLCLRMIRHFEAPRERVFRAFADPQQLVKWWGPEGMHVVDHDIDVRVGGAWRTTIRNQAGDDHTMSGVYREISAPHRLAFTWAWEREGERGHETIVTIDLAEDGDGTELNFVQEIFESEEMRDSHQGGWQSSFDCLVAAIAKGEIR
ncbi:MAG: SRPBCC family protein [Geminicoccaceae bacterium]